MEAATPLRQPHVAVDRRPSRGRRPRRRGRVRRARRARARAGRRRPGQDGRATRSRSARACSTASRPPPTRSSSRPSSSAPRASWSAQFTDQARKVAEHFDEKVDEVFGPENGHLPRSSRSSSRDGSSASVQNRVRELVAETLAQLARGPRAPVLGRRRRNPLADFKAGAIRVDQPGRRPRQHATQRALLQQLGELEKQLQALRDEKEKLEEVEAERERGTAKGRTLRGGGGRGGRRDRAAPGRRGRGGGRPAGATGKTGDVVVAIDACNGPARGRIVFEAKDRRLSKPEALEELDRALAERDADFAVLVVPDRRRAAGEARAAARVQRRQAGRGARPRRRARLPLEVRLPAGPGARADEARGRATASTPAPCATRSSARSPRWRTCARSRASSPARRPASTRRTSWWRRWPRACAAQLAGGGRAGARRRRADERRRRARRRIDQLEL